jgi:Met-10+ like-protein
MEMGKDVTPVVYVEKKDAKTAKNELEAKRMLNRSLRMVACQENDQWVAIPVVAEVDVLSVPIVGRGMHECPHSKISHNHSSGLGPFEVSRLTPIQEIIVQIQNENEYHMLGRHEEATRSDEEVQVIETKVRTLNLDCCPAKLEVLGVDRTVVIPLKAFRMEDLSRVLGEFWTNEHVYPVLWRALAEANGSSRVVRRGEIDPNSPIRQSQYQLLWFDADRFSNEPSAAKWITVVEDGIHQSFHLERVMFSRGNITEKIRFGRKLVQPGEHVLDLYAGIGYFALPAAVHGRASHVTCCEWNPEAGRLTVIIIQAKRL